MTTLRSEIINYLNGSGGDAELLLRQAASELKRLEHEEIRNASQSVRLNHIEEELATITSRLRRMESAQTRSKLEVVK